MIRVTVFCDTDRSAKRYAMALYKYYVGLHRLSKDGEEYKPMIEACKTKVFLPDGNDIIYIDFLDYITEANFTRKVHYINNPVLVWRDRTLTGNKRSLCDLATAVAEIYFNQKYKMEENEEYGNEEDCDQGNCELQGA